MIQIRPASKEDLKLVQSIAYRTWPDTFGEILSPSQIDYMLNWFYDIPHLEEQFENGHIFLLAYEDGVELGFTGIQPNLKPGQTKIHKIYILPTAQGKGIGKKLIQAIKKIALENEQSSLLLNVNKYNTGAIEFYEYLGFVNIKEEVIDIGNGYVMDDYVFELKL
ncbi:GNAT family N-acetyltransferase [Algoriphagus winogradskyi]|uniref:L-amino acid N-acyltransferase YncA n=1 Tax=Algoriphagus winogradskyi TaxID=237017 RepID=A0ABY1PJB2_9BACT|nr:GNAT family N-acetyltransferase [Algoriphagus winogradskyi]SMP34789.1 L-amino acid N-acyltransferase YncA [Algoriphagus winogradskyi]